MGVGGTSKAADVRRGLVRGLSLCALLLIPTIAAANHSADARCQQARSAERLAREIERNGERRALFLQGAGRETKPGGGAEADASSASAGAWIDGARSLVPQLREASASARHDSGSVPGLGDWFQRLADDLDRAIGALEPCLNAPGRCSPPMLSCPPPPSDPAELRPERRAGPAVVPYLPRRHPAGPGACRSRRAHLRHDAERAERRRRSVPAPRSQLAA